MKIEYFLILLVIPLITTCVNFPLASAQTQYIIPQWVRNDAIWWGQGTISDSEFSQAIQYLINNNIIQVSSPQQQKQINSLTNQNVVLQTLMSKLVLSKPITLINNNELNWFFSDSKGNSYHWHMPMKTYDKLVNQHLIFGTWHLKFPDGQIHSTPDYRPFISQIMTRPDFTHVIDQVYSNAGSDERFIYEVWYIVAELTTYSKDDTNSNLWPLEVFTRGEGDCKDKAILIADMLRSSQHTENWKINLEIMDMNNPTNPQVINHMIVIVNTGQKQYAIEATSPPNVNGLNVWGGKQIFGWSISTEPQPPILYSLIQ